MEEPHPLPQILSPSTSGRTSTTTDAALSPEFEFWMVRNPSFPQPNLLSADQLFSDGILLPLHLRQPSNEPSQIPPPPPPPPPQEREASPPLEPSTIDCTLTASKRWRYIFKKNDKKSLEPPSIGGSGAESDDPITKEKETISVNKEKKRDQKKINGGAASNLVSAAELNINIWPFSRSRSAGNGGNRPRSTAAAARKVSSAPCSRSNSTGESKSKKWPNSPSRAGVHLGRNSPVWKVRRGGGVAGGEKGVRNDGRRKLLPSSSSAGNGSSKPKVLSLNVPMCIGYRHQLSCRSDENSAISVAAAAVTGFSRGGDGESRIDGSVSGEGVRRSNLFNIRGLFTKKVY